MQRLLETLSLFVLIVVTILRPLVAETYDAAGNSFTAALPGLQDATPLRTLAFDVAILGAAFGWLVARAIGRARTYRPTGLELGTALIVVAAIASCFFAGNKRLALNATVDWLCYPLLAITLVQLLHRAEHRRVFLAAVLASACVQAAYCAEQYWVGFDETWAHYESIREQFWSSQGVELDSGRVESFEQRILAREATGALPHSNVTGSYLTLCGLVAIGVALLSWRRNGTGDAPRSPWHWVGALGSTTIAAALMGTVLLTKSEGAIVSVEIAIALWALLWGFRHWLERNKMKALTVAWVAVAMGGGAVAAHGLYHDSLPGVSLTFRWQYWKASAAMVTDHPLTGVGRENFGRHYLAYKQIESPEEVSNPHSLFVQAATDWGGVGLIGMILLIVGASYAVLRSSAAQEPRAGPVSQASSTPAWMGWGVGLVLIVAIGQWLLLGTDDVNHLYYKTVTTTLVWALGFACVAIALHHGALHPFADARTIRCGAAMGLFAFILHDTINFAMFVPGTATTLFALLAFCVAERRDEEEESRVTLPTPHRWIPPVAVASVALLVVWLAVKPVARAGSSMAAAKASARSLGHGALSGQPTYASLSKAIDADPLDPTPCLRQAEWLMAVASMPDRTDEALALAEASLDQAVERDPFQLRLRRLRVELFRSRAKASASEADHRAVIDAARLALELYPQDPKGLVLLANCFREAGSDLASRDMLDSAIKSYRAALALDTQRLPWERLRRLRDSERRDIKARIKRTTHAHRALER